MKFEHFALNVPDVRAQAKWYVEHLGFAILRQRADSPYTHFLADDSGRVVAELYTNPTQPCLPFPTQHALLFHFAVYSPDARADRTRLEKAGAVVTADEPQADGSILIMMRDPWGVSVQVCQRAKPFPGF